MELTEKDTDDGVVLRLNGKCTVEHARDLHEALKRAFAGHEAVAIDLSGVEEADITLLQLLLSAALTAAASGKRLARAGALPAAVAEAARVSGFLQVPQLQTFFADEAGHG